MMQGILFLGHWFLYFSLIAFFGPWTPAGSSGLRATLYTLSFSFIAASLLSFRYSNLLVRLFYWIAAIWLGFLNFFFLAACLCWLASLVLALMKWEANWRLVAGAMFTVALVAGVYGLLNARWIRTRRIAVQIPNLPESWLGRRAVMLSDLHLGNINGQRFCRRMVTMTAGLKPDIVFLPGDLFDGTHTDLDQLIAPLKDLTPPFGMYFSTGNHEEFTGSAEYLAAIERAGLRVLQNEKITVDGVHIAGVPFRDSTYPIRLRATLEGMRLSTDEPSILLNHMPSRLPIVEQAGVSLQLSGHTHGGQVFPITWFTRRIFGKFTYGLHSFGALQVYTSYGAGTWGPPMRLGTYPEIVLLTFE
jgi:predicted MPP superfamily phosphohydrolase